MRAPTSILQGNMVLSVQPSPAEEMIIDEGPASECQIGGEKCHVVTSQMGGAQYHFQTTSLPNQDKHKLHFC